MKLILLALVFVFNSSSEVYWNFNAPYTPQTTSQPLYSVTIYEWGAPVQITVSYNLIINKNPSIKVLSRKLSDGRWIAISYKTNDEKKLFN